MTVILGIDPGARWTGFALIDNTNPGRVPALIESTTIDRAVETSATQRVGDTDSSDLLDLPLAYLDAVTTTAEILASRASVRDGVDVIGLEWVVRPSWRHAGKTKPVDPTAIMATGIVAGAIEAVLRDDGHAVVRVRPLGNGRLLPLTAYPAPLGTTGKGTDRLRHERSAYDVAMTAATIANLPRSSR